MLRLRHVAAGIAVVAAACSESPTGSSTTTGTAIITQDVADLAADGAAEDVGAMVDMDGSVAAFPSAASLLMGGGPRVSDCTLTAGAFVCARTRQNGLDVSRTVTFFDAAGATQTAYNNRTTASIHVVMDVSGDLTREKFTATVTRHRDFTVSGLAGQETTRTANGTGTESASRSGKNRNGDTRTYAIACTSASVNVVFPVHSEDSDPWPLSGTSTRNCTVTPATGAPTTKAVVINYNGTSAPTGTVNGEAYTFDLTNRKGVRKS